MNKDSYVSIFVKEMHVNVRIGLLDAEKQAPQALDVAVEVLTDPGYLKNVTKETIIDYAGIYNAVMAWESRTHVDLLETLAYELLDVCFAPSPVQAVKVSVSKPDIFPKAQAAGVKIFMTRHDWGAL